MKAQSCWQQPYYRPIAVCSGRISGAPPIAPRPGVEHLHRWRLGQRQVQVAMEEEDATSWGMQIVLKLMACFKLSIGRKNIQKQITLYVMLGIWS